MLLQTEAFRRIRDRSFAYASGQYLANPKQKTDVVSPRNPQQRVAIPDLYSVRAGLSSVILPKRHVTLSLGMRQDAEADGMVSRV